VDRSGLDPEGLPGNLALSHRTTRCSFIHIRID
jgi:hypothetical protein